MTSFPVRGGLLLSPLHDSLLCLAKREKLSQNRKLFPANGNSQEHSAVLAGHDSAPSTGNRKVLKEKKTKIPEKSDSLGVLKQEVGMDFDDDSTTPKKPAIAIEARNVENGIMTWKKGFSSDTKLKPLSNSNESVKKREVIKDGMEVGTSIGLVKKEFLGSISDQEGGQYEKVEARSSSMEKLCESRKKGSFVDISTDLKEDGQSKCNKVSTSFKANTNVSKCKRDLNIGAMDEPRQKVGHTARHLEEEEIGMPHGGEKTSLGVKKKSKRSQSNGNPASGAEESLMAEVYEVPKENKKAGKMHNLKSQKDIRKACDSYKNVLPETRAEQVEKLEMPLVDRAKDSNLDAVEKKQYASLEKLKEIANHQKADNWTPETILNDAANDNCPAKGVTSEMEPTSVAPIVIEEHWVCCDHCQKWRLLPYGTKPVNLPEKWLCSMLNWLPGMNRCDISEEATTEGLHALYQIPLPESQNDLQNHVSITAAGTSSAEAFDQNHQNLSSHGMLNTRKKKQKAKGTPYAASDGGPMQILGSTKNMRQDVVKRRSLNDMNQPFLEPNLMRKSCNFPVEKNAHQQKEKHANGGDSKQKKLKSKREAEQDEYGAAKKIKAEVVFDTNKYWTTERSGNIDKTGRCLPNKVPVKSVDKLDEPCYKSDRNEKVQISSKKQGERFSGSPHIESLDVKIYDEREISLKKRKLKDWQESQNYVETSRNNGNILLESKVFRKEECSDSELRKAKKSRASRTEGKESSTSKGDDTLNRKNKVTRILLSGNKGNPVHAREEVGNIEKDQQPKKHKIKVASKPASDVVDPVKRDLGSEQFSRTATSSSSKVSDSRKSRSHFPEAKGSPVESVSSSPMRTSNLDKLSLARRDILGKDAVRNGDFPVMDSPRKSLNGEGNDECNRSGTARRGSISGVSHPDSLGFPVLDFPDNNASLEFGGKCKSSVKTPPDYRNSHLVVSDADKLVTPYSGTLHASDNFYTEDRLNKNHYPENDLFPGKSGQGSSLLSKNKNRNYGNNFGRIKVKVPDPSSEVEVLHPKLSPKDEVESGSHHVALLHEGLIESNRIKPIKDDKSVGRRGSEGEIAKRSDPTQFESRGGNSQIFLPHAGKQDASVRVPPSVPGLQKKQSAFDVIPVDASGNDDSSKVVKQPTNAVNHLGYPIPSRRALKGDPSPLRKDGSSHLANNALKEAEDLRYYADRLKDSGFGFESNEAYFQSALKFLHAASLLETCNCDSSKQVEMSQMQIYSSTAKLCEMCAHEYEKRQEMAAAVLAYKCMEVAYMRVVYCKNPSTNRDRHDLQASLHLLPQGESPSSSASDVDNLNAQAMVDKAALSKGIGAHAGNHVIVARNRPNFVRLLDFTKDVNAAMEASRKSQNAFATANVILEEAQNREGIISVKRVIDFSFQDVEELIRLVRLAIEAISCQGLSGSKD
ncbi:hypothetical protein U1Q18_030986 [Sarracenia purpurea var. burkii]